MKVDVSNLMTVKHYAIHERVTPAYIYKLVKEGKMNFCTIDGVYFVELNKFPSLPVLNRR